MIDVETMRAKLRLDATGFDTGMQKAQQSLTGFRERLATTSANLQAFGKKLTGIGQSFTTKLTIPLVAAGAAAVKWSSDLNEASSAVATVFGDASKQILGANESVAKSLGLSRGEALSAAASIGALYKGVGIVGDAAAESSNKLVQASSDLGSFFNVPIDQVLQDIKSGLVGESEPLRKYGILLSEAAVQQRAMADTGKATAKELTDEEKVLARQAIILEGLGAAQGDFARTSEGLANKTRIVKAQFKDAAAQLGAIMLPLVLKAVQHFSKLIERFNKLSPTTKKWVLIAAGIAAVIGPALLVLGSLATALGAIIAIAPAIGAAVSLMLGPFGLLILAVAVLAITWKKNWFDIRGRTKTALKAILGFLSPFINKFMKATESIRKGVSMISDAFKKGGIKAALKALFGDAGEIILKGLGRILGLPHRIIGQFLREISTGFAPLDAILHNVGAMFQDIGLIIQAIFSGQWRKAFDLAVDLLMRFINQYKLVGKLLLGIFQAIPWGKLWDGLKAAISAAITLFRGIDWGAVASTVWDGITAAFAAIPWGTIGDYLVGVADALFGKGKDLLQGMRNGIDLVWGRLVEWLKGRPGAAVGAIGEVGKTLEQKGKDLFTGLRDGLDKKWEELKNWLKLFKSTSEAENPIIKAIGNVLSVLSTKGANLLTGLWTGISLRWTGIAEWFESFTATDGPILSALPNLLAVLSGAGRELLQGLAGGIDAAWSFVSDALSRLWDKIPSWFKSLYGGGSPSREMMVHGNWITQGVAIGMVQGIPHITRALGKVADAALAPLGTDSVSASYARMGSLAGGSGASYGGPTTNNFSFTIQGYDKEKRELADEITNSIVRAFTLREGS